MLSLQTGTPERDTELVPVHLKTLAEALPQVQHVFALIHPTDISRILHSLVSSLIIIVLVEGCHARPLIVVRGIVVFGRGSACCWRDIGNNGAIERLLNVNVESVQ
jgi:hypothetical protein